MAIDATSKLEPWDEAAGKIVDGLIRSGRLSDLGNADLEMIGDEVARVMDAVARNTVSKRLEQQQVGVQHPGRARNAEAD